MALNSFVLKKKTLFQIVLIIWFECLIINCQLNVYNSDRRKINNQSIEIDCLYYHVRDEKLAYQQLSNTIDETILYCFRPLNPIEILNLDLINSTDESYTFEELRVNNITSEELFFWSAPIDLIEEYEYYLNERNPSLSLLKDEIYFNCTQGWFGHRCQYSFELIESIRSINQIVEYEFSRKISFAESYDLSINVGCYIHLECDRGGSSLCLDWREICDGRIDCLNDGIDEKSCFDMEMNECNENEYRCHNGLCIPEEFWEDGQGESECLDRSDQIPDLSHLKSCYKDPTFQCEEHSCRTNWHQFSCGDGQCVDKFDQCHNGRHHLLIESMIQQQNLTDQCYIAIICLTQIINGISCQFLFNNNSLSEYIQTCEDILAFPINPIHLGHIRFLYEKISLKSNLNLFSYPDYICYDNKLCDCIIPTFIYQNLTCIHTNDLELNLTISGYPWIDLIFQLNSYFSSCLTTNQMIETSSNFLYQCQNSSKLISKSRIADENKDCCLNDDEINDFSCLINDKYRIKCPNQTLCLSSLLQINDCPLWQNQYNNKKKIPFHIYCNGFEEHTFEDFDGQLYTDESDCNYWPCQNLYSQCDGHWLCSNGEDEYNCSKNNPCPLGTHPCITISNYSFICLSKEKVGDNQIDCLGGSDEPYYCREMYPFKKDYQRFRCLNSDLCLSINDLCDGIPSCPLGDDEHFCQNSKPICQKSLTSNQNLIENILCQSSELNQIRKISFSIASSNDYPQLTSSVIPIQQIKKEKLQPVKKVIELQMNNPDSSSLFGYCNRGLSLRLRSNSKRVCMCPPSYYGNLCEYQNERISLTLGIISLVRHEIYTIIIMLIDDNDEEQSIDSYEKLDYSPSQSCQIKLNRYLLYPTRPKNLSKNYSLRIDIFEKRILHYRGSWYLSVPFLFLPVNRLSVLLRIPQNTISLSSQCSHECFHGQCVKYLNKEKSFCRCFSGWSGVQCNIQINCQSCSSDSICLGSTNNRSICICPLNKFGPRCLLNSNCQLNSCQNNGQCIPSDLNLPNNDYICICPEQYFGDKCQYIKAKLEISIEDFDIPSHVIAYFFTVSEESEPRATILIEKLTLFQRTVTFYLSIEYHIGIIKSNEKYYLAVVQKTPKLEISTRINPSRECEHISNLFNSTMMKMIRFQRLKSYHILCQTNHDLVCFIDEYSLCLCTNDHQTNCFEFDRQENLECSSKSLCLNEGQCFQDHPHCPSSIICVCPECFFGDQCQYYTKGFGLTLDEILGYEIKSNLNLLKQSYSVKLTVLITMFMFIIGLCNGIFSILTFKNKICQEVGCGFYLYSSSIFSLILILLFTMKFCFLFFSFQNQIFGKRFFLYTNCLLIEPLLKLFLYINNWLNACIAIERAFAVYKGIYFNKKKSKYIAKWVIRFLILINLIVLIPQLSNVGLYNDQKEERSWCVVHYSLSLYIYNSFLMYFHFLIPFLINICSSIFIIYQTTRQKILIQNEKFYIKQFQNKFKRHKHLIISPIILIILSSPYLIISFTLNCQKSSKYFWLNLIGYFLSFIPAVLGFVIFVLPSALFRKAFKQAISRRYRRYPLQFFKN